MWTSLQDVVARAGSFDDVRPLLEKGRIMARAEGFYTSEGNPWKRAPADGHIPTNWWAQSRNVDPAANRATFRRPVLAVVSTDPGDKVESFKDDITAIGIELESAPSEALWPEAKQPTKLVSGKPGPKGYDGMWPKLFRHLELVVASRGKRFASYSEAAREGVSWLEGHPKEPQADLDTVRAKIRETRPDLVGELIGPE